MRTAGYSQQETPDETATISESRGVAQPGSASALGAEGRGFESLRPDHLNEQLTRYSRKWLPCLCPFCAPPVGTAHFGDFSSRANIEGEARAATMSKTALRKFVDSTLQSVAANFLYGLIVTAGVTFLSKEGSVWTRPLINGALAGLLFLAILLAAKILSRLPPTGERVTLDNVEQKARHWLDRSSLTVQRSPWPTAFFRFIVTTTEGGK